MRDAAARRDLRQRRGFILGSMTASHAGFHAFRQSLWVMLPHVRDTLALSDVQAAALATAQELAAGAVDLPGGVLMDFLRRFWGLIMAVCTGCFGLGWLLLGLAPTYPLLLLGMAVVAASASLWHLPAMAALSHRFAERRGFALSVHGMGGNVGDILGPSLTGLLLAILSWRGILSIYAVLPLLATGLVFWAFRHIGTDDGAGEPLSPAQQLAYTRQMLTNRTFWGLVGVAGLRGMAFVAFTVMLALYTKDVLGLPDSTRGFYFGLLHLVGLGASPLLGHLSDRWGRKVVLVPGLLTLAAGTLLLVWVGEGVPLVVLLAVLGIFLYSDQPILTAAALDVVGRQVTTSAIGLVSFSRLLLSAPSPALAGWLYDPAAAHVVFAYIAGLFGLAALALLLLPLPSPSAR
ncbi:MAG: lactate dehydrogenase [Candidatus Tectimicrobiota bacterium]|nr:MAG: lactate dehydrogenase [Candidatus Tectomicrobia bacterium]